MSWEKRVLRETCLERNVPWEKRGKKYTSGPRYWNVPVLVNTGTILVYQYCLKMWYLRSLERAGVIQKLTILERKNILVLSNTRVPVSGTWSILFPKRVLGETCLGRNVSWENRVLRETCLGSPIYYCCVCVKMFVEESFVSICPFDQRPCNKDYNAQLPISGKSECPEKTYKGRVKLAKPRTTWE